MNRIIVSLTSYGERLRTLPRVLDTMFRQTRTPDGIVLNLSDDQPIPDNLLLYLQKHPRIRVNRVPEDTKVWKKFLPTFDLFPDDLIMCIDDDFLYPSGMIEEFEAVYKSNPSQPVSGNTCTWYGLWCHCGCASLVKREWFEGLKFTPDLMANCKSSDFAYTWLLAQKGIYYQRTQNKYFKNMPAIEHEESWTNDENRLTNVPATLKWLEANYKGTRAPKPVLGPVPKVWYNVPWSSEKNIGKAYNEFAALVPDTDWICFMDADTIPTTSDYGAIIERVIRQNPSVEAFTCTTNRIGCGWQLAENSDWSSDDMRYHRRFGEQQRMIYGATVEDVTDKRHLMSGHLICCKKSLWKAIGGVMEDGMLGIDNDFHRRIKATGHRLHIARGLYVYHWYRGGNRTDTKHLK